MDRSKAPPPGFDRIPEGVEGEWLKAIAELQQRNPGPVRRDPPVHPRAPDHRRSRNRTAVVA